MNGTSSAWTRMMASTDAIRVVAISDPGRILSLVFREHKKKGSPRAAFLLLRMQEALLGIRIPASQ